MVETTIVLASASPRRKELLKKIVPAFEIDAAKGEEKCDSTLPPERQAEILATHKAEEIANKVENKGKIVIGADTIVVINGRILGKPHSEAEAKEMLTMLSGKEHHVITGVCVIFQSGKRVITHEKTAVVFDTLTEEWIDKYIKTGSPMDKAGAYGIQDGISIAAISGSYDNVVGFPTDLIKKILEEK